MTDTPELLPCPFCGGTPGLIYYRPTKLFQSITCYSCGYEITDTTAEAWNTRPNTVTLDHANAMVAGAYDHCARLVSFACESCRAFGYIRFAQSVEEIIPAIRSSVPTDAQTALDALIEAERAKCARLVEALAVMCEETGLATPSKSQTADADIYKTMPATSVTGMSHPGMGYAAMIRAALAAYEESQ